MPLNQPATTERFGVRVFLPVADRGIPWRPACPADPHELPRATNKGRTPKPLALVARTLSKRLVQADVGCVGQHRHQRVDPSRTFRVVDGHEQPRPGSSGTVP